MILAVVFFLCSVLKFVYPCVPTNSGAHDLHLLYLQGCTSCKREDVFIDRYFTSADDDAVGRRGPIRIRPGKCHVMSLICEPRIPNGFGTMILEVNRAYLHGPSLSNSYTIDVTCDGQGRWIENYSNILTLTARKVHVESFRCNFIPEEEEIIEFVTVLIPG